MKGLIERGKSAPFYVLPDNRGTGEKIFKEKEDETETLESPVV